VKSKTIQQKIREKERFVNGTVVAKHIDLQGLTVYHIRTQERRIATYDHHGRIIWLNNKPVPAHKDDKDRIRKTTRQIINVSFPSTLKPTQGVLEIHYQNGFMIIDDLTTNTAKTAVKEIRE